MLRPYVVDDDDAVNMIWHDYERVGGHPREMDRNLAPTRIDGLAIPVHPHNAVDDLAEHGLPVLGDHGDVIGAGQRVVVGGEADGATTGTGVMGHVAIIRRSGD